jgi:serine phosphatase RsbU (regulator of sigma subunit)
VLRGRLGKAFVPAFILQFMLTYGLGRSLPGPRLVLPMEAAEIARLQSRLTLDGIAAMCVVGLGYACFVYVTITGSRRYVHIYAEMVLASEFHRVLVPSIHTRIGNFEFHGRSLPSEVGGDLIDLAGTEDRWAAYVAEVSGHGVTPGIVMAMVKRAAPMLLSSGHNTDRLFPRAQRGSISVKGTRNFCHRLFSGQRRRRVAGGLAGHPAILHFSPKTNDMVQLECPNLPLGILPSGEFVSSGSRGQQGSVFALYSDGLLETANAWG